MGNDYAEMYHSGKVPVFDFSWKDDPRKSQDWLKTREETYDAAIVAQEIYRRFDAFREGAAIPAEWVDAAIELYDRIKKGEIEYKSANRVAGLDVAAGGLNRSVMIWREGIVVQEPYEWNINNTTLLVQKAGTQAELHQVDTVNFDPIAVGIGARSTFELSNFSFRAIPVDARTSASEEPLPNDTKPARDRCRRRRDEIVMRVRARFEKTFEFIKDGVKHDVNDMVALPAHTKLKSQLSMPEIMQENGKWHLESKERMVRRGIDSPDYFDACMLCFAEEPKEKLVIQSFDPRYGVEDFPIQRDSDCEHYVSIQHDKELIACAVGAFWWPMAKRLAVYGEAVVHAPSVAKMTMTVLSSFRGKVDYYVGNREMFGKRDEEDSLFFHYMSHGIIVYQNFQYNEIAAIGKIEEMFSFGTIKIHKQCKELVTQLSVWDRKKGAPNKEQAYLAFALCNMINHLQDNNAFAAPAYKPQIGPYGKGTWGLKQQNKGEWVKL